LALRLATLNCSHFVATALPAGDHGQGEHAQTQPDGSLPFAAESDPDLPAHPVRALRRSWFKVERRTRVVATDDLPKFYRGVLALPNQIARDYLLLLLFTGLRRTEAATLTWDDVNLNTKVISIPGERTKSGRKLDLPDLLVRRRGDAGRERFVSWE
jgi:integrase